MYNIIIVYSKNNNIFAPSKLNIEVESCVTDIYAIN